MFSLVEIGWYGRFLSDVSGCRCPVCRARLSPGRIITASQLDTLPFWRPNPVECAECGTKAYLRKWGALSFFIAIPVVAIWLSVFFLSGLAFAQLIFAVRGYLDDIFFLVFQNVVGVLWLFLIIGTGTAVPVRFIGLDADRDQAERQRRRRAAKSFKTGRFKF